jgi:hypothetical protein
LLFPPGSNCIALQLQFWLVNHCPSKVGQFSFEYSCQSHKTSSAIPLGEAGLSPPPTLSLCYFSSLGSLRVWLLAPPPFSGVNSAFHPTPAISVRLQFTVYALQFCWREGSICPEAVLDYVLRVGVWGRGRGGICGACCSPVGSAGLFRQL